MFKSQDFGIDISNDWMYLNVYLLIKYVYKYKRINM